jgi:hypothetical protein
MRGWPVICLVGLVGCATIPEHGGYKSRKAQPWNKAKPLTFKEGEAKVEGELDYADYRRAKWWVLDLPTDSELTLTLEQAAASGVDVAMEVLDPNFQVIMRADLEEEDAFEEEKTRTLYELRAGRYLIHLYLQKRLDKADYELRAKLSSVSLDAKTDFPAHVAFIPELPVVPLDDDTPARRRAPQPVRTKPREKEPPKETGPISGRIINVVGVGGGVEITINRGTAQGVSDGMKGRVNGLKNGSFTVSGCGERSCKATVKASASEVGAKSVSISP